MMIVGPFSYIHKDTYLGEEMMIVGPFCYIHKDTYLGEEMIKWDRSIHRGSSLQQHSSSGFP
jgi:UDP-3-O-[3-hydroxymyristoyl] glucosamine N-acyltransferase